MKRFFVFLVLVLCCGSIFAQQRVIVMMKETYDELGASKKMEFMTKAQRRDFVIQERKAFCMASQQNVMDFLNGFKDENAVRDIKQFWSINGFSCVATDDVMAQLAEREDVAFVYRDVMKQRLMDVSEAKPAETRDMAWHVEKVNAPAVWNYNGSTGYTGNGVIVAVLDTGVNYNHVDIAGSMWNGGSEFPHHGYDFINNDNDPMDDYMHGTHCAGIVAGQGNAGTQTGIAPGAKIMAVKIMDETGYGGDEHIIAGIEFALAHGADILSCSFGDPETGGYALYRQLYETVLDAGVVAAVAAGNVGDTQFTYPRPFNIEAPGNCPPPWFHPDQTLHGGHTAVVCVGATDATDTHSSFSSVGPVTWSEGVNIGEYHDYPYEVGNPEMTGLIRPDISAPGSSIVSLGFPGNTSYESHDGTSMATPCVAGVMALMLEANPTLTPAQIDSIIELTAVKIGGFKKNNTVGSGRVDALAAIDALFFHGPANLTANFDGDNVDLNWEAPSMVVSYEVYRDGLRIANNITSTSYTDHLNYGGRYTYYVTAVLNNGIVTLPSNYVIINKTIDVEAEIINDQRVSLSWNMPNGIFDGFESGDFYQNMWLNDGTSPWVITNNNPYEGVYCAKSTNVSMFSTSSLRLAVNVPVTCVISYAARISCIPINGGGFLIDNVQQGETIKGEEPWGQYSYTLTPGNHQLEWKYVNQLNEGEYENAFYIDNITVGNPFNVYRAKWDGANQELVAENVPEAHYVDYEWETLIDGMYKYGVSIDGGYTIAWSDNLIKGYENVEENDAVEVAVYPNPVMESIHVETQKYASVQRVDIYDVTGQLMISTTQSDINVSALNSGVYYVNIVTAQGVVTKKITVLR